ncbi:MAG: hypothetical protein ABSD63_03740 [Candidatus Korobacteraceae bacterium]|jgi:hypothetical protein
MPKIVEEIDYDGARERVKRLGLTPLVDEVKAIVSDFELLVEERADANGGAAVRKLLDARFEEAGGWTKKVSGDIDWTKCKVVNGTKVCVGVEVQVSARSDLLVVDMIHLTAAFRDGRLDAGIVIVPSDKLSRFLTDRGPCISDAKKHAKAARLEDSPLILLAIEHDGPGPFLAKQAKRITKL